MVSSIAPFVLRLWLCIYWSGQNINYPPDTLVKEAGMSILTAPVAQARVSGVYEVKGRSCKHFSPFIPFRM
jgi:hypothetical protein